VHPFASLTDLVPYKCPRVLINIEEVGDIGKKPNDVVLLGKCDEIIRELCQELGWEKELDEEWAKTKDSVERDMAGVPTMARGFTDNGEEVQEGGFKNAEEEANDLADAIERYLSVMGLGEDDAEGYSNESQEHDNSSGASGNEQLSEDTLPDPADDNPKAEAEDAASANPIKKL
jgi:NAD+-dependent protein deacetylase SIR2